MNWNEWLEKYMLEKFTISPVDPEVGVVIASKKEDDAFVVTIFKLIEKDENNFTIVQEVATFHFESEVHQREFIESLPEMSTIDFIFLLNSSPMNAYN